MSLEQNDENIEFLKEFASDSQDILGELNDSLSILRNHQEDGKPVLRRTSEQIARSLSGIQSSAEFLGQDPIYQISLILADYFEHLPGEEHLFTQREVDTFSAGLSVLGEFMSRLEESGSLGDADDETHWILDMIHNMIEGEEESHPTPAHTPARQAEPEPPPPPPPVEEPEFNELDAFQIQITPEMLDTYISEAEEHLEEAEASLLGLEKNLNDKDLVDNAFRGIHTFKGNSGLFNFAQLEKLGHEFETILEKYKSGETAVDREGISLMLRILDVLKSAVHELPDGEGAVENFDDYLTLLQNYQTREKGREERDNSSDDNTLLGEILVEMGAAEREHVEEALSKQSTPVGELLRESGVVDPQSLDSALQVQKERRATQGEPGPTTLKKKSSSQNIRVDLYKLDTLMNLVGELIIAENTVTHNPDLEGYDFQNFKKASLQLNRISRELQDISLSLRMIPIEATFHRMVRVVRDVSHKQKKEVALQMYGEDTEVDKSVVESLAGPLLHIIRNAIDHGIETPEERDRLGKPREGIIELRAFHEGGEVVIEISDDGKGMDPDKILAKAREKGLVGPDEEVLPQEALDLVFLPGFSTAEQVTDISGRGVGMDVVKKDIESIKGRVHINSEIGRGTIFSIRIPLTLAIIEGMLTRVGNQLFTIPLLSIRESLRTENAQISHTVDGGEMVRIRERLVPVVRLHRLFNMESEHEDLTQGILVVVDHERKQMCLFADEILGQYQTVIKGLSNFMGNVRGISGSSIMSNGDISLILDIPSLVAFALEKNRHS